MKTNRVVEANCVDFLKTIPDNFVDLVIIDIPYLLDTAGGKKFWDERKSGRYHDRLSEIKDGFEIENILPDILRISKKLNIYIFLSKRQHLQILKAFEDIMGDKQYYYDMLIWHKTNAPPLCGNSYIQDLEYICFFREPNTYFHGGYENASKLFTSATNQKDGKEFGHPTCKPVNLIEKYILQSCPENGVVMDCFAGSGSTAIAAIRNKRNFIGCDIEKKYVDIANNRIEQINNTNILTFDNNLL